MESLRSACFEFAEYLAGSIDDLCVHEDFILLPLRSVLFLVPGVPADLLDNVSELAVELEGVVGDCDGLDPVFLLKTVELTIFAAAILVEF